MTKVKEKANTRTSRQNKTSNRYNRGQLSINQEKPQKNYLFTVDKLILNCKHGLGKGLLKNIDLDNPEDEYISLDTKLIKDKKTGNGTKRYKYGYDVIFNNQSVGLLLLSPRMSFGNDDEFRCSFQLYNHILYQKAWTLILMVVLDELGIKINNVSNLDIACDGHGFVSDYEKLLNGKYENVGKSTHRPAEILKGKLKGFYIGKRSSDKCMCGYFKSRELKRSGKTYISDYWKKNNLKDIENVERLELRLKNKGVKSIGKSFDINLLEDPIYLASIFKSQTTNYYQFVLRSDLEKDSKVTRHKKIDVINWDKINHMDIEKEKRIKKPCSIWAMKHYLKCGLLLIHAGYHPSKKLFNSEMKRLDDLAEEYELEKWFNDLKPKIQKRDKGLIAEMKFNRMEIEAGNNSIYFNHSH